MDDVGIAGFPAVRSLASPSRERASEDARRVANLVSENFPVVAASSRQRGQRSSVLSELARLSLTVPMAAISNKNFDGALLKILTIRETWFKRLASCRDKTSAKW